MTKVNKSEGKLPRRLEEGDAGENLWAFSDCSHYLPSIIYYWHLILQERERMLVVTFMPGHHFEELQGCKKIRSIENKVPSYSRIESSQIGLFGLMIWVRNTLEVESNWMERISNWFLSHFSNYISPFESIESQIFKSNHTNFERIPNWPHP